MITSSQNLVNLTLVAFLFELFCLLPALCFFSIPFFPKIFQRLFPLVLPGRAHASVFPFQINHSIAQIPLLFTYF